MPSSSSANMHRVTDASSSRTPRAAIAERRNEELAEAIARAQQNLLRQQKPDGHWCGELFVDSTLCSDYVLFMHWLGEVDDGAAAKVACAHILKRQLARWRLEYLLRRPERDQRLRESLFRAQARGPSADAPCMQEARANILRLGGIPRMNTYSKLYLALLGQFPWKYLPTIPVEMVLLPNWCFFNIYKMSSWSRAMLIPLAIINHFKPTRELPATNSCTSFIRSAPSTRISRCRAIERFFDLAQLFPARRPRLEVARSALHGSRCASGRSKKPSAGWSSASARGATAWPRSSPRCSTRSSRCRRSVIRRTIRFTKRRAQDFEGLFVDDPEDFRIQPCLSPVWDTAINVIALAESPACPRNIPRCQSAAHWLVSKEVRHSRRLER